MECVGLVGCRVTVFCGLGVASFPQPPDRSQHGCTVGIDRDSSVWDLHPGGVVGGTRAPAFAYVSAGAGVVVHVVVLGRGGFTVYCLSSAQREKLRVAWEFEAGSASPGTWRQPWR